MDETRSTHDSKSQDRWSDRVSWTNIPPSVSLSTKTGVRAFAFLPLGLVPTGGTAHNVFLTTLGWMVSSVGYWLTSATAMATGSIVVLQIGAEIADFIVTAIQNWLTGIFTFFLSTLLDWSLVPLLRIANPVGVQPANEAWSNVFEIAIALFPILIIFGILNMPLADQKKASLWRQGFRVVTVVVIIALSQPLWGLAVDVHNAAVMELAPEQFKVSFDLDSSEFGFREVAATFALFVAYLIAFILMLIAVPLAILGLVLRDFIVYLVYIVTPLLAVLWYPDWGLTEQFHEFANKLGRMGLYVLLSGPLLAIAFRTVSIVTAGGIMEASGDPAVTFWKQLVLALAVPFIILAIVWKSISWAGKPIGLGKAYGMLSTTAFILASAGVGAVAGGATGALPGGQDRGSGSSRSSGSGAGGGATGSGTSGGGGSSAGASGNGTSSLGERMRERAGQTVDKATEYAPETVTERAAAARERLSQVRPSRRAAQAQQRKDYLTDRLRDREVELGEAYERGVLVDEPANPDRTVSIDDMGRISYTTAGGQEATVNLQSQRKTLARREKALRVGGKAGGKAARSTASAIKKVPGAAKRGTKATVKAGAYGMAEPKAVYAYSAAQRKRIAEQNDTGGRSSGGDGGVTADSESNQVADEDSSGDEEATGGGG
jgi:type IV secretion system protein TrbL